MSVSDKPAISTEARKVNELAKDIEHTRAGMSSTIHELEHRLSPGELGGKARVELDHIETRVKAVMSDGLQEARGVLDEKILAAKEAAHAEILEAKAAVQEVLADELKAAKQAVHEEILVARGAVKEQLEETKELVTRGLSEARDTVKKDIQGAIAHTKQSIRDATLGKVETIATKAGDAMNTTRDTLVDTIRQNPVPAALAGIGIAWLLMNRSKTSRQGTLGNQARFSGRRFDGDNQSYGVYSNEGIGVRMGNAFEGAEHVVSDAARQAAHRASDVVHQVGGAIGNAGSAVAGAAQGAASAARSGISQGVGAVSHAMDATGQALHHAGEATTHFAHEARDAAGNLIHTTADAAGHLGHQAQHLAGDLVGGAASQARRVERGLEHTFQANPLALGAVAMAVGAAVGYSLPRTHREDELMGDARDRILDGATHMAHDASHSLFQIASEAGDSVKEVIAAAAK